MGRKLDNFFNFPQFSKLSHPKTLISAQESCTITRHTLDSPHLICQWPYNLAKLQYKPGTYPTPIIVSYSSRTNPYV